MSDIRIQIIGTSCSGKSTLAKKLSDYMNIKHIELDELFWEKNWVKRNADEFYQLVQNATAQTSYVCCGNYSLVRDVLFSRATHIIWLNYSFIRVFWRALRRSIKRIVLRENVCNGNIESFRKTFFSKDSILLWVIQSFAKRKKEYPKMLEELKQNGIIVIELKKNASIQQIKELILNDTKKVNL